MGSIVIAGDTSGTITLQAPAVAGSNTITVPASTGTLVTTANSNLLTWQSVQTTGFTATAGSAYPCNTTSAAFTVTLPATWSFVLGELVPTPTFWLLSIVTAVVAVPPLVAV